MPGRPAMQFPQRDDATGVDGIVLQDVLPKRNKMWWQYSGLRMLNFLLLGAISCDITNGFDGSMLNGLQILPQWQQYFNKPKGATLGLIANGARIGQCASLFVISPIIQRYGRRKPIAYGSILMLLGIALQTGAQNLSMFVVGRVILGFGNTIQGAAAPILLAELAYPSQRPTVMNIMNVTGSLGQLMAAWITFGTGLHIASSWSWRLPSLLQGASSVFQIVMVIFMPESPRWLVYHGRKEEARAILCKYHAEGDNDSKFLDFEMAEIDHTIEYEKVQRSTSWSEWFRTPANRYRFMVILSLGFMIQWGGNAILSYYLHLVLDSIGIKGTETQLYINGGYTLNGFVWGMLWSLFIDRFGRRFMFLGGMAGMFVAFLLLTIFTGINQSNDFSNHGLSGATVFVIFLFGVFYKMAGPTQDPYFMEISPYELRAKTSVIKMFGDAGANLFSGFVNPIALDAIEWKYYIVWCCVLVTNFIVIYLFFPETKGLSLEEVEQMFDGIAISKDAAEPEDKDRKHPTVEFIEEM